MIHEFGHALGLGHEHQRSDFWRVASKFIDVSVMTADLQTRNVDVFGEVLVCSADENQLQISDYDPESVMHYWLACSN